MVGRLPKLPQEQRVRISLKHHFYTDSNRLKHIPKHSCSSFKVTTVTLTPFKMSEYRSGESASQPTENSAFTAPENPITRNNAEVAGAKLGPDNGGNSHPSAHRGPSQSYDPEGGNEWAMGRGERGAKPVDEREMKYSSYADTDKPIEDTHASVDSDLQIADVPAGEGKVADAVEAKHGVQRYGDQDVKDEGHEGDFASDLDR